MAHWAPRCAELREPRTVLRGGLRGVIGDVLRRPLDQEHESGDGTILEERDLREVRAPSEAVAEEPDAFLRGIGAEIAHLRVAARSRGLPALADLIEIGLRELPPEERAELVEPVELAELGGERVVEPLEIAARVESRAILRVEQAGQDQPGRDSAGDPGPRHVEVSAGACEQSRKTTPRSSRSATMRRTS